MYTSKLPCCTYIYPLSSPSGTKQQLRKLVSQITNLVAVAALDYTYIRSDTDFTVCMCVRGGKRAVLISAQPAPLPGTKST